jgi:hypothetical protein
MRGGGDGNTLLRTVFHGLTEATRLRELLFNLAPLALREARIPGEGYRSLNGPQYSRREPLTPTL